MKRPRRIVSGAQTGVDRAALDVALELDIPCGGRVPKGRRDEKGRIPARYPGLEETATADWNERTEANVRDSDGTLILSRGRLTGGSKYTAEVAARLGRPWLHLDLAAVTVPEAARSAREWIDARDVGTLNVAGPRASKDPGLYELARRLLREVLTTPGRPLPG
ncbi:MAG: putative molybdenum carrier protein [Gemmatimonadota bacterium]